MTTGTRQTAGNNAALRSIKQAFNAPIYAKSLALMNESGPEAVADYIGKFFNAEARAGRVAAIMAGRMPWA